MALADRVKNVRFFASAPDKKTLKNRLHMDLRPDDQGAEVARLLELGATRADIGQAEGARWVVLADPEGKGSASCRPAISRIAAC